MIKNFMFNKFCKQIENEIRKTKFENKTPEWAPGVGKLTICI